MGPNNKTVGIIKEIASCKIYPSQSSPHKDGINISTRLDQKVYRLKHTVRYRLYQWYSTTLGKKIHLCYCFQIATRQIQFNWSPRQNLTSKSNIDRNIMPCVNRYWLILWQLYQYLQDLHNDIQFVKARSSGASVCIGWPDSGGPFVGSRVKARLTSAVNLNSLGLSFGPPSTCNSYAGYWSSRKESNWVERIMRELTNTSSMTTVVAMPTFRINWLVTLLYSEDLNWNDLRPGTVKDLFTTNRLIGYYFTFLQNGFWKTYDYFWSPNPNIKSLISLSVKKFY